MDIHHGHHVKDTVGPTNIQAAANGEHVATFKNVSGCIGITLYGTTLNALSGSTLFVPDRIVCGTGSSAGIVFKDSTQLTLGPSTDIQVRDCAFDTATIGVRGTRFIIEAD